MDGQPGVEAFFLNHSTTKVGVDRRWERLVYKYYQWAIDGYTEEMFQHSRRLAIPARAFDTRVYVLSVTAC